MHAARRVSFAAALAAVSLAAAQPAAAQPREPDRLPQIIIEGDGFIVIDGAEFLVRRQQVQRGEDPIPPDDELWTVRISEEMRDLVARLDAEDFEEREAATRALIDTREPHLQFYAVLARDGLGPEARQRLLGALVERLLFAPRGALGIRMDTRMLPGEERTEVRIVDLIPGLPAERIMRIGDRITHIEGQAIRTSEGLIELVQSRRPGDVVRVSILRARMRDALEVNDHAINARDADAERLDLTIELGSTDLLDDPVTGMGGRPFDSARRMEAAAAEQRFGPPVREVKVRGR